MVRSLEACYYEGEDSPRSPIHELTRASDYRSPSFYSKWGRLTKNLPPRQCLALKLWLWEDMTLEQTAMVMKNTKQAVAKLRKKAILNVRVGKQPLPWAWSRA